MLQILHNFFNWKENPGNVFYLAIPIAFLGFILTFHVAYLHIKLDYVYLYEWIAGIVILAIALIPPLRGLRRMGAL